MTRFDPAEVHTRVKGKKKEALTAVGNVKYQLWLKTSEPLGQHEQLLSILRNWPCVTCSKPRQAAKMLEQQSRADKNRQDNIQTQHTEEHSRCWTTCMATSKTKAKANRGEEAAVARSFLLSQVYVHIPAQL